MKVRPYTRRRFVCRFDPLRRSGRRWWIAPRLIHREERIVRGVIREVHEPAVAAKRVGDEHGEVEGAVGAGGGEQFPGRVHFGSPIRQPGGVADVPLGKHRGFARKSGNGARGPLVDLVWGRAIWMEISYIAIVEVSIGRQGLAVIHVKG